MFGDMRNARLTKACLPFLAGISRPLLQSGASTLPRYYVGRRNPCIFRTFSSCASLTGKGACAILGNIGQYV